MAENAGATPSIEAPEYDGPLVNGVQVLTVEVVREWGSQSRLPELTVDGAVAIAKALNHVKFLTALWHPDNATERRSSLSAQRYGRVAKAVETLILDLPAVIAHVRRGHPTIDRFPMEDLLNLAKSIAPSTEQYLPKKGRKPDLAHNVAINIGKMVDQESVNVSAVVRANAKTAFVAMAMEWLGVGKTEEAFDRVRQRRAQPNAT